MSKVLILDQSKSMRKTLCERLQFEGFDTEGASELPLAIELFRRDNFDVILSDTKFDALPDFMRATPYIVLSADSSIDSAMEAAKMGALDFLTKPLDMNRLLRVLREATHQGEPTPPQSQVSSHVTIAKRRSSQASSYVEPMIGESEPMQHLKTLIDKVAPSEARVLVMGENGTGKELVAKWLHYKSHRANGPFVEINCAAIPSELIESELFGHEKGAFTSAIKQRKGKFEQANDGTLFMDEIGDMSLAAQAKVLRALQEHKVCRVGSDRDIDIDVRVIAATNKDIRAEIAKGNFREDLYHRLSVIVLNIPPLRERAADIAELIQHFLSRACIELRVERKKITPEAVTLLSGLLWSGNIRELRNVVERLVILGGDLITVDDVNAYVCDC